MTPTQAQREAAAKAMEQKMFAPHELPLDDELHAKYIDTATAALTAAAETGSNWEQSADGKETIRESRQALEAEIERLRVQVIERDSAIAGWIKREAATIERCAQVAECIRSGRYGDAVVDGVLTGGRYELPPSGKEIAAAIRALKNEP